MKITEIDTPALLIDREIVLKNLEKMQKYADKFNVSLRYHYPISRCSTAPVSSLRQHKRKLPLINPTRF